MMRLFAIIMIITTLWLAVTTFATAALSTASFVAAPVTKHVNGPAFALHVAASSLSDENTSSSTTELKESMDVRQLIQLLEQTYPSDDTADVKRQQWTKTRKYLYQYRANLAQHNGGGGNESSISKKRKRISRNRGPLTTSHIQQIITFLEATFPARPDLHVHILQSTPRILSQHHSIESKLVPTVEFLKELYGDMPGSDGKKGTMFIDAIQRNPNLLLVRGVGYVAGNTSSDDDHNGDGICSEKEVEEYLQNVLEITAQGITRLKRYQPTLFQLSLKSKVQPAVEYLQSVLSGQDDVSIGSISSKQKKQLVKIVMNHSNLLQLDVDSNIRRTTLFLQDYCQLTDKELATIVGSIPAVLGLSVDGNLKPKLQLLLDILKMGTKLPSHSDDETDGLKIALRKALLKHPKILGLSSSNIRTKADYFDEVDLKSNMKQGGNTLAARLLMTAPSVYSLSLGDNIVPKVEYFASLWGWSSLSDKLCECPLLTLSMDNIRTTLSFYNMTGYIELPSEEESGSDSTSSQQSAGIVRSRYIATSLYNRLLPRWNFLLEEQERKDRQLEAFIVSDDNDESKAERINYSLPTSKTTVDKVMLPPLHLLAGATDEVFCRQLNLSLSEYIVFKEEAIPRLKFNSQFDRWLKTGRPIDLVSTNDETR